MTKRALGRILLAIGLFQIAIYFFSGSISCPDGIISVPHLDSPLYYQAARRIVEGHPFSYSEGESVCTGTTTVIYPFLLAVPYALGFSGDSLAVAGFVLNACFYLLFLFSWGCAIRNWSDSKEVKFLAPLLLALSGHCAISVFSQTDVGFWLAFSGLLALALSQKRKWLTGVLLALAPWVRPEGIILLIAFSIVTAGFYLLKKDKEESRTRMLICIIGVISTCGLFAFNYILTGKAQFSSILGKGHFATLPFDQAVAFSLSDLITIVKGVVLGISSEMPRGFIALPVLSGLFFVLGLAYFNWKCGNLFGICVFLLAVVGGFLNVAQSGWQGTGMDRYLIWTIPVLVLFTAQGAVAIGERLADSIRWLPSVLLVMFALVGSVAFPHIFHQVCQIVDNNRLFFKECDALLPKGASVGGIPCAPAYFFSPRRLANLSGIYSPEFVPQDITENLERLRNNPETRFDYWIVCSDLPSIIGSRAVESLGDVLRPGPHGKIIMKADWRIFNPRSAEPMGGRQLVARVDVGYRADEASSDYQTFNRWGFSPFAPVVQFGKLGDKEILDVGRVVLGGDEMSVPLTPGRDVTVVFRTWPSHTVGLSSIVSKTRMECAFSNPLRLNVAVDGSVVETAEVSYATEGFSDVSFTIPGSAIKNPVSRIGFLGDHITFGYWFYQ